MVTGVCISADPACEHKGGRAYHSKRALAETPELSLTAFWLDFQGLGPPGEGNKREKTASKLSSFFLYGKETTQTVCFYFNVFLVSFWGAF